MPQDRANKEIPGDSFRSKDPYGELSREILRLANRGVLRAEFLKEVSRMIMEVTCCDTVEIRTRERGRHFCSEANRGTPIIFNFDVITTNGRLSSRIFPEMSAAVSDWESLLHDILFRNYDRSSSLFGDRGFFKVGDETTPIRYRQLEPNREVERVLTFRDAIRSFAVVPFTADVESGCLLILKCRQRNAFSDETIEGLEGVAQNLGVALVHRHAQIALRERVKELTCLYGLAKMVGMPEISQEELLQGAVQLLPPAMLYPEVATARILLDGREFVAAGFGPGKASLSAEIKVAGVSRGLVEVIYKEEKPELDEGPFLNEERNLIDTVAGELAIIIERRQSQMERNLLQEQLRHADRLATIGQLAAGVAHELNEPLGGILGFAQLALKNPELPASVSNDIKKIINASLHAREIIKKLMVFARQLPPQKMKVNLNQVAEEGLYFLEARCSKSGIEIIRQYAEGLPEIVADPSQLHQVLINLVVNAVQAMPQGGALTMRTERRDGHVALVVEDTGIGMSADVLRKIFVPFFTTKDLHEGTGLGLSVVHGIVSSHGGTIKVESRPGAGSRFEVELPVGEISAIKESEDDG